MADKMNKTCYGIETDSTPRQIITGRVKQVLFDKKKGYANCLMLEERYRLLYETAIIFQKKDNVFVPLTKYRFGQRVEHIEPDMTNPVCLADVIVKPDGTYSFTRSKKVLPASAPEVVEEEPLDNKNPNHKTEPESIGSLAVKTAKQKWGLKN